MIFNEIKCHVNTCLGLVGGCIPCIPPWLEVLQSCTTSDYATTKDLNKIMLNVSKNDYFPHHQQFAI